MKKVIVVFILLAGLLFANEYENVAKNFIAYQNAKVSIKSFKILKYRGDEVGYLFNLKDKGYLVIPVSKTISPVKAFSFDRNYIDLPPQYKTFLTKQLYDAYKNKTLAKSLNSNLSNRWEFLENYKPTLYRKLFAPNKILLKTSWNQNYPYNKYLPKVGDKSVVAGCIQVAVAQVMKYWNYPKIARGVLSRDVPIEDDNGNTVRTDSLKAYLHRYYDWSLMPDDATNSKEYAVESVAHLMSDLLVVDNVKYAGTAGTLADINMQALVENFGYSNSIKRVSNNDTDIKSIIQEQIDNNQPVIISISAHMAVVDGYKDDDSGDFVHINLGWGGMANDYYDIDKNNNAGGYTLLSSPISIVYNIKPCSKAAGDCYKNLENNDKIDGLNITGIFDSPIDKDKYKLFLSGDTTLKGSRGYSSQAFYISIYNSKNELVKESDKPISIILPADLYTVSISLMGSKYYTYEANYSNYNVNITTDSLSEDEKNSILHSIHSTPYMQDIKNKAISSSDIIPVYAYDTNSDSNLTFSAVVNNDDITVSMQDNILYITPNVDKGYSKIKVTLHSGNNTASKIVTVLISNQPIYFGKDFSFSSKFLNNNDIYKTKVILDGNCTISGNNFYANQDFFTKIEDENGSATTFNYSTFHVSDLKFGFYYIDASLSNGSAYYPYTEDDSNYTISVSCPNAEENITKIANLEAITIDNTPFSDESNSTLNIKNLTLSNGWNLVSFDGNISKINDIKIAWQYHNGRWMVYAPLYDISGYGILDDNISSSYGTWAKVDRNTTIHITKSSITYPQNSNILPSGWHLNGTPKDIPVENIICRNGTPDTIWKYFDGNWQLHTNIQNSLNLEDFTIINANEGYWINCP